MLLRDSGDVVGVGSKHQILDERPPGSLSQLGDHASEFGDRELDRRVLQPIAVAPVDVAGRRRIESDLHSVRPRLQHPLDRAAAPPDHERIHHPPHSLGTAKLPPPGMVTAPATLIPTFLGFTRAAARAKFLINPLS